MSEALSAEDIGLIATNVGIDPRLAELLTERIREHGISPGGQV